MATGDLGLGNVLEAVAVAMGVWKRWFDNERGSRPITAMDSDDFSERLSDAAVRVSRVADGLPETRTGRHVAGQLVRCGTASAPNYDEACGAESRADFVHKISIAHKEMRETCGWLRFILKRALHSGHEILPLWNECDQLRRMLSSSARTARKRPFPLRAPRPANPQSPVHNPQSPKSLLAD